MKNFHHFVKLFFVTGCVFFLFNSDHSSAQNLTTITWDSITIKAVQKSCGFLDVIDLDKDSKLEIVMSTLMESGSAANQATTKGAIRVFNGAAGTGVPATWTETMVLPTDSNLPFINTPQVFDVDEDGNLDIMVQEGFLKTNGGGFYWMKGPNYTQMTPFAPDTKKGSSNFFWHESVQYDLDGDGKKDIITTCADNSSTTVAKKIEWYRHMGNGVFNRYTINDTLGGVFIKLYDVDKDGDKDIVVSQFFGPPAKPSIVWLEQTAQPSAANSWKGTWNYHKIDCTTGLGYYFEFFDINGDGADELVYGNHNNLNNTAIVDGNGNKIESGLFYFDIPSEPANSSQWTKHVIADHFPCDLYDFGNPASQGSPGIWCIGDIDLNGYPDIIMPGDGMSGLYMVRQKADHSFVKEKITGGKMWGMAKLMDYDNDGVPEIVGALHNFPDNILQALNMPAGKLMIFKPANIVTDMNENNDPASELNVYPNPANDLLTLTFTGNMNSEIKIRISDVFGKEVMVMDSKKNSSELKIDLSNLPSGTYILNAQSTNNTITKKIIKL